MRRDVFSDAGEFGVLFDDAFDRASSDTAIIARSVEIILVATVVEKERRESVVANGKIIFDPLSGGFTDENGAVLATLATNYEFAATEIDRITVEVDEFGNAETAREEKLDDGAIAKAVFGIFGYNFKQAFDFVKMEKGNLFTGGFREIDEGMIKRFNAASGEVFKKAADGDEVVGLGDGKKALVIFRASGTI